MDFSHDTAAPLVSHSGTTDTLRGAHGAKKETQTLTMLLLLFT